MQVTLPTIAGAISTVLFVVSYLPMLVKAVRTKDLSSYSLGNLVIANVGNVVHSVYVFSLPAGPIWLLHTFYLLATAAMLYWHRRYVGRARLGMLPRRRLSRTDESEPELEPQARLANRSLSASVMEGCV